MLAGAVQRAFSCMRSQYCSRRRQSSCARPSANTGISTCVRHRFVGSIRTGPEPIPRETVCCRSARSVPPSALSRVPQCEQWDGTWAGFHFHVCGARLAASCARAVRMAHTCTVGTRTGTRTHMHTDARTHARLLSLSRAAADARTHAPCRPRRSCGELASKSRARGSASSRGWSWRSCRGGRSSADRWSAAGPSAREFAGALKATQFGNSGVARFGNHGITRVWE